MRSLKYFESEADRLSKESIDYRLVSKSELILSLMKRYRTEHQIGWMEYKQVYDKWFAKYK